MNHAVEVKNLSVTYDGKVKALDSVSLEIPVSRITGLIGPSGSGKTTLIKSIVGRLKLPADKVVVLDLTAGSAKLRKSVAYMSQELAIYSDLTVKQNLTYFARVIGYKYSGVRRRVNETLRVIDMYDKRNSLVENLSGGQRQRVSLGVALLGHPKLLVLDEPTVGLDPVLIENLWQLFHQLVKEDGTTIIISSHSMSEASRCDDLVLMRAGKIIATGAPKRLLQQTKTQDIEQAFLKLVKDENCAKEDDICYPSKNILTCHPELDSGSNNKEATNNNNTLSNWIPDRVRNDGINFTKSSTTASRVLRQLIHDPRTLMLIFAVPPLLLWLLKYVFDGQLQVFNQFAPAMLGIFPMVMMFLITSITTLRERRDGTLARLMSLPLSKTSFLAGYALAFSLVAAVQAILTTVVMIYLLGIDINGGTGLAIVAAIASALLGTAMGLFASAFARTEFQAIQFMPALLFPQILLCGLFVARDQMGEILYKISDFLPLTYSTDLMKRIAIDSSWSGDHTKDLLIIIVFIIGFLIIGALTIRRQEKVINHKSDVLQLLP